MFVRFWCHTCNEFTLHDINNTCTICSAINTEYDITTIPEEKLLIQRKMYSHWMRSRKLNNIKSILSVFGNSFAMPYAQDIFSSDPKYSDIIETDAGQKAIDDEQQRIKDEMHAQEIKNRENLKLEYNKYKDLGRNDKCVCGSGKKYKNCHMNKFQQL